MENDAAKPLFSVSDFLASLNQTLEYAYPGVFVEGEVASFKVNQGKYVFFDLKDDGGTLGCFMTVWQLRTPIEDGMKVIVGGTPKLTPWGKFSLTVQTVRPSGEGSLKKSFELMREKLEKEGLFAAERKRPLPTVPRRIGMVTSTAAAGYADFVKILNDRWGGLQVDVAHVQVQGQAAPEQMIRALRYFNEQEAPPEVIVLVRGGGSADDLAAFNDEPLVRQIAASRVPTLVGVGHEVDTSLADLAADVRAATPSNAAQLLVPDRREIERAVNARLQSIEPAVRRSVQALASLVGERMTMILETIDQHVVILERAVEASRRALVAYDPRRVLERGYAIVRGARAVGSVVEIEQKDAILTAEVQTYDKK